MIRLTSAFRNATDRTCLMNPLHIVFVGPMIVEPVLDTPESREQFENLCKAYPSAQSEIQLPNGRAIFVQEPPSIILQLLEECWKESMRAEFDVRSGRRKDEGEVA